MAMAACAAAAAHVGVRPASFEAVVPRGSSSSSSSHGECRSASFGVRKQAFPCAFSLQHRSTARAAPTRRSSTVVSAVAADKAVETADPSTASAPQVGLLALVYMRCNPLRKIRIVWGRMPTLRSDELQSSGVLVWAGI